MRGELRASPPGAAELGQEAGIRSRPGALPALRRRAEDHCGDPGSAGDREDPQAPGIAGAGTATLIRPRSSAASGLAIPVYHRSGGSQSWATAIGCARGFSGPMDAARWQGVTHGRRPERRISAGLPTPDRLRLASKRGFERFGRCVPPLFCRAPGCRRTGERAFQKAYPLPISLTSMFFHDASSGIRQRRFRRVDQRRWSPFSLQVCGRPGVTRLASRRCHLPGNAR